MILLRDFPFPGTDGTDVGPGTDVGMKSSSVTLGMTWAGLTTHLMLAIKD